MKKTAILLALATVSGCIAKTERAATDYQTDYDAATNGEYADVQYVDASNGEYAGMQYATADNGEYVIVQDGDEAGIIEGLADYGVSFAGDSYMLPEEAEAYIVSANRTANKLLKESAAVFEPNKTVRVFVEPLQTKAEYLPKAAAQGTETLKRRLSSAENVKVVEDAKNADYIVTTSVDMFTTATSKTPVLRYDLVMSDKDGVRVGDLNEVVRQVEPDKSWW